MGTSNFRRLMSCWINWDPVDPSQLVPSSLLPLLLGNRYISSSSSTLRKYRFPIRSSRILSWKTNFVCDGRMENIRRLPHAAQCWKSEKNRATTNMLYPTPLVPEWRNRHLWNCSLCQSNSGRLCNLVNMNQKLF